MPSEKVLKQKQGIVAELAERINGSVAGVVVDYKGITVEEDTKLRKELREAGVEYFVVKNTLLKLANKDTGLSDMDSLLEGTTALALSKEDPVVAAKILDQFASSHKDYFNVKCGFVEGKMLSAEEVSALAKLPSREMLVAQVLAGFNAPITGFVNVLNANIRGLAIVLNAIVQKQA